MSVGTNSHSSSVKRRSETVRTWPIAVWTETRIVAAKTSRLFIVGLPSYPIGMDVQSTVTAALSTRKRLAPPCGQPVDEAASGMDR